MEQHRFPVHQRTAAPSWSELEQLLTVADVGRLLRLSRPKVYELIRQRGLPSLKIGGSRRFERASLLLWIEQQRERS